MRNGGKEPLRRNPGWNAGGFPVPLPRMKKTQATAAAWQHGNREGVFCAPRGRGEEKSSDEFGRERERRRRLETLCGPP